MTKGLIQVTDRTGGIVALLHWEGHPMAGKARWEYLADGASEKVRQAVEMSKGLGKQSFSDMYADGATTRGWEGFSGWFQALSLALPEVGLTVDADSIVWPSAAVEAD